MKVGVCGARGRIGSLLMHTAAQQGIDCTPIERNFNAWSNIDTVIDFSGAQGALELLDKPIASHTAVLICSTGFANMEMLETKLRLLAQNRPVMYTPNVSIGIILLDAFCRQLSALFPHYDVHIMETHHKNKKDAPSGTARMFAKNFSKCEVLSIRAAQIPGKHIIKLTSSEEEITLEHNVLTPEIFAKNALRIAQWLCKQCPGQYTIEDILRSCQEMN